MSNVIYAFNQNGKSKNVCDSIDTFLMKKASKSPLTATAYKKDIEDFFHHMTELKTGKPKKLDELELSDLIFEKEEIEKYQIHLAKKYIGATVDRKIYALKSLYNTLEDYNYPVRGQWFKLENLASDESKSWGIPEHDIVQKMIELARYHPNGHEKSLLLELASVTSFRLNSLVTMTWDSFSQRDGVWTVTVIGKRGKRSTKSINDELYQKFLKLKEEQETLKSFGKIDEFDNKVFHFTTRTADRVIERLRKELGIDPNQQIVFHSLKKYGIHEVKKITNGDMKAVQQQADHSDPSTTIRSYFTNEKDYSKLPSLHIGKKPDFTKLESLSKEEMLSIIAGKRDLQIALLNELNKGGQS